MKAISQLLTEAGAQKSVPLKVKYLQQHCSIPVIKQLLGIVSNPKLKWALPEGAPPFKPSEYDEPGILYAEVRRLYIFLEGGNNSLTALKREKLFVELLEALKKEDAELLINLKDGKWPYGLSAKIVWRAFPEFKPTDEAVDDSEPGAEAQNSV